MNQAATEAECSHPRSTAPTRMSAVRGLGLAGRLVAPLAILALGVASFWQFSYEVEKEKDEPAPKQLIRTNVTELKTVDYRVMVTTNGVVQPHNEVALSAQVGGQVIKVNPAFEVGAYFSEGDVLLELDSRDYATAVAIAEAQEQSAYSALRLAEQDYARLENLLRTKNVSDAEVSQADATRAQAAAQLASAQAQLEQAERDLERTKIYAPFDGRVRVSSVGLGQTVGNGTPLGIVFAIDFAEVRLPISGSELEFLNLPELADDAPVEVEFRNAINKESPEIWKGEIVRTEGALDVDSLELFAIARIDDPFGRTTNVPPIRIGQPVVASIPGIVLADVLAIPRVAMRQLDQVNVVDDALTLRPQVVNPLWSDENYVIIRDPNIEDGTLLSTTRLVYAPEGGKVEIIPDIELTASTAAATEETSLKN